MSKNGSGGGIFANLTPQDRSQIVGQILQGVSGSSMQSGSPLLAGLAPILSAMIGARARSRAGEWQQEQHRPIADELLGDNPQARRLAEILGQPNLPEPYRRIAQQRLDAILAPAARTQAAPGRSGRAPVSALSAFVDPETNQQMIVTRDGRVIPAVGGDGQPYRRPPASPRTSRPQAEPVAPAEPAAPAPDPIAEAMTAPAPRVDTSPPGASPLAAPSLDGFPDPSDPLDLRRRARP